MARALRPAPPDPSSRALTEGAPGAPERVAEGRSPEAAEALAAIDRSVFLWRRRMMKGELVGRLIAELGLDLEVGQVHALVAVTRIEAGLERDRAEPATVGLLAEELALDPSRASRVAADLVQKGLVRREAAQRDGRRTVLRLTPAGRSALERMRRAKEARLREVFAGWPDGDVVAFSSLLGRYLAGMAAATGTADSVAEGSGAQGTGALGSGALGSGAPGAAGEGG